MNDPFRSPTSKAEKARRWVRMAVIVAIVVAALIVLAILVGGGHGPARHF